MTAQRTILPLRGHSALRAFNVFCALLLGLKMLPAYISQDFPAFFEAFGGKTDAEKETMLREAVAFVELSKSEVESVIMFATDSNGIPYGAANLSNLTPDEIFEVIVAVCMEIGRIKIDLVTSAEKKS